MATPVYIGLINRKENHHYLWRFSKKILLARIAHKEMFPFFDPNAQTSMNLVEKCVIRKVQPESAPLLSYKQITDSTK